VRKSGQDIKRVRRLERMWNCFQKCHQKGGQGTKDWVEPQNVTEGEDLLVGGTHAANELG